MENFHREDLDPIDAARGRKAIAEEFDLTKPQLAEQIDMSVTWVSERLRLLALPESTQELITAGVVPVEAERVLRQVAEVSPQVSNCVCVAAKRHDLPPSDFVRVFGQLFQLTCEDRLTDKPAMIDVRRMTVSRVISGRRERAELAERINTVDRNLASEDPQVCLGEPEVDAARAAGCFPSTRSTAVTSSLSLPTSPTPRWPPTCCVGRWTAKRPRCGSAPRKRPPGVTAAHRWVTARRRSRRMPARRNASRPRPMPRPRGGSTRSWAATC